MGAVFSLPDTSTLQPQVAVSQKQFDIGERSEWRCRRFSGIWILEPCRCRLLKRVVGSACSHMPPWAWGLVALFTGTRVCSLYAKLLSQRSMLSLARSLGSWGGSRERLIERGVTAEPRWRAKAACSLPASGRKEAEGALGDRGTGAASSEEPGSLPPHPPGSSLPRQSWSWESPS